MVDDEAERGEGDSDSQRRGSHRSRKWSARGRHAALPPEHACHTSVDVHHRERNRSPG